MDDQITSLTLPQRWGLSFGFSVLLWVLPPTFKAPNLAMFLSFLGSTVGFGHCIILSGRWATGDRRRRKLTIQSEERENYQLALDEEATKRELAAMYFPDAHGSERSAVSAAVSASPTDDARGSGRSAVSAQNLNLNLNGHTVYPEGGVDVSNSVNQQNSEPGSESLNAPNRTYTAQNLTYDTAIALIGQMALTMSRTQIVEGLWKVKRGGNKAYKAACQEFDNLIE
jgi:hypothetical protein